jgi:alkanesulfonate monooxygenase SsuD/methylene tetrahydromethanopterin reductase-like flavin-dependent oxidoreductase (luciferase family)
MRFGLVLKWHSPMDAMSSSSVAGIDELVGQIQVAERVGFTSVWLLEHDVVRGDVPAAWPQELISRIAMVTRTIRIGHRLWSSDGRQDDPVAAAERASALDLLCDGRLEIDCSPMAMPAAALSIGRSEDSRPHPAEAERQLRAVVAAWSDGGLGQQNGFFELPDQAAIAKPLQRPHPPLWVSVKDTSDWVLAGKLGMGVLASAPPDTALQSRIDTHRHAASESARRTGASRQIAVSTLAICSSGNEQDPATMYQPGRWPRRRDRLSNGSVATLAAERPRRSTSHQPVLCDDVSQAGEALARMGLLIGNSEQCTEVATAYAKIGVDRLLCHFPSRAGNHAKTTEAITRFGNAVMAAFA